MRLWINIIAIKGFDVVKSAMKDHVRLIGPEYKSVKNDKGGAAFSYAEAAVAAAWKT
jgi:hypothetical protein